MAETVNLVLYPQIQDGASIDEVKGEAVQNPQC